MALSFQSWRVVKSVGLLSVGLLLVGPGGFGCTSWETGEVAHARAAELLSCPQTDVQMVQRGAYRYRGTGCGRQVSLACSASALEPTCLRERSNSVAIAEREPENPPPVSSGAERPIVPTTHPQARSESTAAVVANTETEAVNAAGRAQEAALREILDANSALILACVGAELVALRAQIDAEGMLQVRIQGPGANSPEERCVQVALAEMSLGDGAQTPMTVVHVLRAAVADR